MPFFATSQSQSDRSEFWPKSQNSDRKVRKSDRKVRILTEKVRILTSDSDSWKIQGNFVSQQETSRNFHKSTRNFKKKFFGQFFSASTWDVTSIVKWILFIEIRPPFTNDTRPFPLITWEAGLWPPGKRLFRPSPNPLIWLGQKVFSASNRSP